MEKSRVSNPYALKRIVNFLESVIIIPLGLSVPFVIVSTILEYFKFDILQTIVLSIWGIALALVVAILSFGFLTKAAIFDKSFIRDTNLDGSGSDYN